MVLKLFGYGLPTCTRLVGAVLRAKKVPFQMVTVDVRKNEQKSPGVVAHQPFGQIPFIVDDASFVLFESRAICRYLATKYADRGPALIPTGLKELALFEQAASIEYSIFHPHASKAITERLVKPLRGLMTDQAVFDEQIKNLSAKLDVYEVILGKQKYMAGDEFTLVDIFHLPYGDLLKTAGSDIMTDPSRPNVLRWWNDITSRPLWVAVKDGHITPNV